MSYQVFRTPTYPSAVPVQSPLLRVSESPFPAGDPQGGQRAFPALLGLSPQGLRHLCASILAPSRASQNSEEEKVLNLNP